MWVTKIIDLMVLFAIIRLNFKKMTKISLKKKEIGHIGLIYIIEGKNGTYK